MTTTKKTATTRKPRTPKAQVKLPPNPFMHEILELVNDARSKPKKVEILKEYETPALKSIFIWNFDPSVVSLLPEGQVPYNANEVPVLPPVYSTTLCPVWISPRVSAFCKIDMASRSL